MSKPLVSVVIPNYNYSHYLCEAVDSALAQTYRNFEIIVVDDGSKDDSREVLQRYGDKITVIFQHNQGVAAARNRGVAEAAGEYVAFLDADDAWLPAKIEKQVSRFGDDTGLGLVHVGVADIDDEGNLLGESTAGMEGNISAELLMFRRPVILGGGSGIMVPRRIFDEIGGFDTRLSTSADWDFFYRISSRHRVGFVPEVLLKYRVHGSNMHGNIAAMEHDMMLGYEKAFADGATANSRECYGNLHRVLAGSYFRAGRYTDFARHTAKSIWNTPSNFGYFAAFPLRWSRKKNAR